MTALIGCKQTKLKMKTKEKAWNNFISVIIILTFILGAALVVGGIICLILNILTNGSVW